MLSKKVCLTLLLLFISPSIANAQLIDLERAYSLYYAGDYETCIQEIDILRNSTRSYDNEDIAVILYCGIQCCQAYIKQLKNNINFNNENSSILINKIHDVLQQEYKFVRYLDVICNVRLKYAQDLKTKYRYLLLKIFYNQIIADDTEDSYFAKESKKCLKQFAKEIYPHLQNGEFSIGEIISGYSHILLYYTRNGKKKDVHDCMFNIIEPWFCNQVVNNDTISKAEKLTLLREYKSMVNLMNVLSEYEDLSDKYINDLTSLNIRAKNMSYYLNGNEMYRDHIHDQWQQIQKVLKDGELAVEFCNAKSSDEHVFAFIFDNKSKYPKMEYCGHSYWAGRDVHGFSHLLERSGIKEYTDVYYSSIEEMAFIDMGHNDRAHKLHSISELLMPEVKSVSSPVVYSFADINFTLGDSTIYDNHTMSKGALTTEKLRGAKEELLFIKSIIPQSQLHTFEQDNATKQAFLSLSGLTFDILHISTHGYFDKEGSRVQSIDNLLSSLEGTAILDNCGIKLAGYNDDFESGYINATEIANMDLSNVGLVILSACETGTGGTQQGHIYSLAEAFHNAGVRCIIATTTEVEDDDACTFFKVFMAGVVQGISYHDSFVKAQAASRNPKHYVLWE